MTLFKQISIMLSLFILLVLGTVMNLNFKTANEFIQNQLYASAEDTATSLGLSLNLVIPEEGNDYSTMETMISAIFDRGYYESIILYDTEENIIIERRNSASVQDIPNWFTEKVTLQTPTAHSIISAGWVPFGAIAVKIHSGYAYMQLWSTFIEIATSFAILVPIVLTLLYLLLSIVLKALKLVEEQATAITNNDFIIQEKIPFTTEFKSVVNGMNKMVVKVKEIFDKEAEMVQKYNNLLYKDQDTGLGNRKYFALKLSSLLNSHGVNSRGTLVLLVFNNYENSRKSVGFHPLNSYINSVANTMNNSLRDIDESIVARLKESDFALIIPQANYDEAKKIVQIILKKINSELPDELRDIEEFYISGGATYYEESDTQKEILSRADFELAKAKMRRESYVEFHQRKDNDELTKMGQQEWHHLIKTAIEEDGIKLALQQVINVQTKEMLHMESYLRMMDEKGTIYPAGLFMPMLNELNLADHVDKRVLELTINKILENPDQKIAINIAAAFIKNASNLHWIEQLFKKYGDLIKGKLSFESSNYAILNNMEAYIGFVKIIRQYGLYFGIDNFSVSGENLNYLQNLKPAYIKADKSFFIHMAEDKSSSSNESFQILTNSLDIMLIATAVENETELKELNKVPITLQQGSYIVPPVIT